MDPLVGRITPVKAALGVWLSEFYAEFSPDTAANAEWAARGAALSMAFVPGRMVDVVEDMISSWRVNNNSGKASTSAYLPVVLVAVAQDYTESPAETGRQLTDKVAIAIPGDPACRSLRVRLQGVDLRVQVVVVASDATTGMSIMGQLCMWATERPKFKATHTFQGFDSLWPVTVVSADRIALPSQVGEHLSVLPLDLIVRATLPIFYGPGATEATDGNVPPGFPVTQAITTAHNQTMRGNLTDAEFAAFIGMSGADSPSNPPGVILLGIVDQTTQGAA